MLEIPDLKHPSVGGQGGVTNAEVVTLEATAGKETACSTWRSMYSSSQGRRRSFGLVEMEETHL